MFKSYVTVALRSMLRQRFHAAINVLGLAIGMTCVILIAMYIRWELGFNTQFPNTENLYRVVRSTVGNESQRSYTTRTSGALAGVLGNEYPEVLDVTRLFRRPVFVSVGDKALSQLFCLADDNVFDTFPHVFEMGDAVTLARSPGSLVISQTLAQKLFGERDPIGQTLKLEETGLSADYRVCGVFFKPNNSTIQFDLLATLSSAARVHHRWANWRARGYRFVETFMHAREGVDIADLEKKIQRIFTQYMDKEVAARNAYHLQPFNQIYLYSSQMYNIRSPGGGLPFEYGDMNRLYLAGLYPAFVLSTFKPISVLKSETASVGRGFFRQTLVVFQFTVSIVFISLTFVIADQMKFIAEKDLGYRREGIIALPIFNVANQSSQWEILVTNSNVKTAR